VSPSTYARVSSPTVKSWCLEREARMPVFLQWRGSREG
jgi:hypothetical protein